MSPGPIYRSDLAYIHHRGFSAFSRRAAPELLRELRRADIASGRVIDLGCGDGTWLRALTEAGFDAVGIDRSAALVRHARRTAPRASVRIGSVHRAVLPSCVAITAVGEVLSYRTGGGNVWTALARLFRRAWAALDPGGLFVFDLLGPGPPMAYDAWRSAPAWAVLVRVSEDVSRSRVSREIVTFRRIGSGFRRSTERHVLDVLGPRRVAAELRRAGFRVRSSRRYGRFALLPRRVAFFARKPTGALMRAVRDKGSA